MQKRILGESVKISYKETHDFFEQRASKYDVRYPYITTMYQDNNPELTVSRNEFEKVNILPYLRLSNKSKILDIGCGVGRWADALLDTDFDFYKGIDFSPNLIDLAISKISDNNKRIQFQVLSAQNTNSDNIKDRFFNCFIVSGVLLYLNDEDVINCFKGILSLAEQSCIIYIREPVSIKERLTLDKYYSEELQTEYSAIYRSIDEYVSLINQIFRYNNFVVTKKDFLFNDLNNRKETAQYFFILERK